MARRKRDPLGGRKTRMVDVIAELAILASGPMGLGMRIANAYRPFINMCLASPGLSAKQIAWDIMLCETGRVCCRGQLGN